MKIRTHFIVTILLILFPLTAFTEEVYFYHTDNFGTPMVMTDINGEVVWRSDELPFGEEYETIENPIKNNRRYLGKEMDEETGFIYMGSRYLNPATGQFNRPDPVGLVDPATGKVNQEMLLNPQRLNRYAYGLNNPYRYVDPDGNVPKDMENSGFNPYELEDSGIRYAGGRLSGKAFGKALWGKLKGVNQNRNLRTLTHQDLTKAFKNSGFSLSNHAIKRLKDPRTQKLGFKTPNDIMQIFNKGKKFDAGRGEVGFNYKKMEAIVNPRTKRIITFRPEKKKRD